jgi:hypothetical protein
MSKTVWLITGAGRGMGTDIAKAAFRTDLLTPASTTYAEPSIEDYAQRTTQTVANWTSMNGKQGGDPAKLADALIKIASPG